VAISAIEGKMDLTLSDDKIEQLLRQGYESPDLDYKETFDNSDEHWMKLAKDVFAMANHGGGYIVFGVPDGNFIPAGMDTNFHIDSSVWSQKFNNWSTVRIELLYKEYVKDINGQMRKFPILYISGVMGTFALPKMNGVFTLRSGEQKAAFTNGVAYTRVNDSSVPAQGEDYFKLIWGMIARANKSNDIVDLPLTTIELLQNKAKPYAIQEPVWSNLFPVTEMPDIIYSSDTSFRYATEIYDAIRTFYDEKGYEVPDLPTFLLKEGKIYSFEKLNDKNNPLSLLSFSNKEENTADWIADDKKRNYLTEYLNLLLKKWCRRKGFAYDKKRQRFYAFYNGGSIPEMRWKPAKRESTRPLVYIHKNNDFIRFYEHFGGKLRFVELGNQFYLLIEPVRVLTADGRTPVDHGSSTRFHTKKNTQYHNNNYLYDVKFWLFLLSGNRQEILLNSVHNSVVVSVKPLMAESSKGILEDSNVDQDFLDELKSTPLEYESTGESFPEDEENPLSDPPLEG